MPYPLKDLTGRVFGRLTVLLRDTTRPTGTYWLCQCECGQTSSPRASSLASGQAKSCGCLAREQAAARQQAKSIGNPARVRGTLEYFKCSTWGNINKRTVNGSSPTQNNRHYLDRGVELRMSKDAFYAWCDGNAEVILNLYRDGQTPSIDRVDSTGHYEISNLRILDVRENRSLADKTLGIKAATVAKYKPVILIHPDGRDEWFPSRLAAAEKYGLRAGNISQVIRGEKRSHGGFKFRNPDSNHCRFSVDDENNLTWED